MGDSNEIRLDVPEDLVEMITRSVAYSRSIKILARIPFTLRKIKELAYESQKLEHDFWRELKAIYPEVGEGTWTYNFPTKTVFKGGCGEL